MLGLSCGFHARLAALVEKWRVGGNGQISVFTELWPNRAKVDHLKVSLKFNFRYIYIYRAGPAGFNVKEFFRPKNYFSCCPCWSTV